MEKKDIIVKNLKKWFYMNMILYMILLYYSTNDYQFEFTMLMFYIIIWIFGIIASNMYFDKYVYEKPGRRYNIYDYFYLFFYFPAVLIAQSIQPNIEKKIEKEGNSLN